MKNENKGRLVIERKIGSSFSIGDDIQIYIDQVRGNFVRVSITAPKNLKIVRDEMLQDKDGGVYENGLL